MPLNVDENQILKTMTGLLMVTVADNGCSERRPTVVEPPGLAETVTLTNKVTTARQINNTNQLTTQQKKYVDPLSLRYSQPMKRYQEHTEMWSQRGEAEKP